MEGILNFLDRNNETVYLYWETACNLRDNQESVTLELSRLVELMRQNASQFNSNLSNYRLNQSISNLP